MSYGFDMLFLHCKNIGEAFSVAHKAAESAFADLKKQLEEVYYIPSVRYSCKEAPELREANKRWLRDFLTLRFVWWPDYQLLGLVGSSWPKAAVGLFAKHIYFKHIYFQDSCDQDYDFETWEGIGAPFDGIAHAAKTWTVDGIIKLMQMGREFPEDYVPEDKDEAAKPDSYSRRSAAYNAVFATLELEKWLWGKDDPAFMRFALTPLNSPERTMQAETILQAVVEVYKRGEES